jgi:peptidoglycan/LPS O-acetylase OafA/YrhL
MDLFNPLWFFIVLALCLLLSRALHAGSAFFRARVAESDSGRFEAIDGLRGICALGVFFTHAATSWFYYAEGRWTTAGAAGDAHFYGMTGSVGVSLFFMITGLLFWRRALRAGAGLDARALYTSRIRRIVPMYLASVALVLLVVAALSGFRLHDSPVAFLKELRPWLSFGFMETGELNGVRDAHNINAVYWTLAFEWMFYLSLPLLAHFAHGWRFGLLCALVLYFGIQAPVVLNFLAGALTAVLLERRLLETKLRIRLNSAWLAPLPVAALAWVFTLDSAYSPAATLLMFVFFVFVAHGNSIGGLLRTAAAKLLGTVSYSVYLVHCIVVFVTMRLVNAVSPLGDLSPLQYWTFATLAAFLAVGLSALTYRFVEHPFLAARPVRSQPVVAPLGPAPAA